MILLLLLTFVLLNCDGNGLDCEHPEVHQASRRSLHRQAVVLHLSRLQVLDDITITLEERTRAELLSNEAQGSSSGAADMTLPGLVPLMTRPVPLRRTSLNPGIHTLITDQQEDTHDIGRYKKQRGGVSLLRGLQNDVSFRQIRGASSHYPTVQQPTGHRVFSIYPNSDLDSRYQFYGGPRPKPPL